MTDETNNPEMMEEVETASPSSSKMATFLKSAAACALLYSAFSTVNAPAAPRRMLSMVGDTIPSYMDPLMKDLRERKKLFEDTPPEAVKYWFEYAGPLQVCLLPTVYCFVLCTIFISFIDIDTAQPPEILLPILQISWQSRLL